MRAKPKPKQRENKMILMKMIVKHLSILANPDNWGSEEEVSAANDIFFKLEELFDYNLEEDYDAQRYFLKATDVEVDNYVVEHILPKL
jgi:hypothetical protein